MPRPELFFIHPENPFMAKPSIPIEKPQKRDIPDFPDPTVVPQTVPEEAPRVPVPAR